MDALSEVATLISASLNLLRYSLWLALESTCFVGQTLVYQSVFVFDNSAQVFRLFYIALEIVYNDSLVFFKDLIDKLSYFACFTVDGISHLAYGVTHLSLTLTLGVANAADLLYDSTNCLIQFLLSTASFAGTFLTCIFQCLLLFGSYVWLTVTKAPLEILNCLFAVLEQIRNFFYGIKFSSQAVNVSVINAFKEVFFPVFDASYSSLVGLLLGVSAFYSAMKNYRTVCSLIFQLFSNCCFYFLSLCHSLCVRHQLTRPENSPNVTSSVLDDKLCVVCQEMVKEIILLPCRHICLCVQCCLYIVHNQRICPICRSNIDTVMKVYM